MLSKHIKSNNLQLFLIEIINESSVCTVFVNKKNKE
jgi:hypothetical protein